MAKEPRSAETKKTKRTPVMQQFADAKAEHPDAILFFRLGDFYEMFFDDAIVVSQLLGLTLTSRQKEDRESEPMCGVPHHSAHAYIAKLLAFGHKVALCEQLADPSKVKGIVPRAVVRVLTPGLVTSEEHLEARENLFLAAVECRAEGSAFGVAFLDFSTGELFAAELETGSHVLAELVRHRPREILLGPGCQELGSLVQAVYPAALRNDSAAPAGVDATLAAVLGADGLAEARKDFSELARSAAARTLAYARACSPRAGVPVRRLRPLASGTGLYIDETAQAHLELVRTFDGRKEPTLLSVLDRTLTSGGARLLRRRLLAPLSEVAQIRARQEEVEAFVVHARVREQLRALLAKMPDLERIAVRVALAEAGPRDLGQLRDALRLLPQMVALIESIPATVDTKLVSLEGDRLNGLFEQLDKFLVEAPPVSAKDGGVIRDGVDKVLDRERALERGGTEEIARWEGRLRTETGAQTLRIRYNSVFGWYVEVTKSQLAKVPASFVRKQTVAGGERYTTPALDQLAADIERAATLVRERELELLTTLLEATRVEEEVLRELANRVATWDFASSLAEVAHECDFVKPQVDQEGVIEIIGGRHPVVEAHVARGAFVPNDTVLDLAAGRLWLVTGPNMAGKSTLMRQVALITLLAQVGSYVPAERARIGVVDRLLSRVGASDNLARGESTFMVEMRETASILKSATARSLVILDEIGRGTSTYDGLAIAWAVAEYLHDVVGCRALFATHYHELTELAKSARHLVNVSVSAREHEGGIVFLHTLLSGPANKSYGIAVARLAGLPQSVLSRAEALCEELEQGEAQAKGRGRTAKQQLGLFGEPAAPPTAETLALSKLRSADVDRMTPLEALNLLAKLKQQLNR